MVACRKLSVDLTEELAREIETAVANGDYADAGEAVRDALLAWKRERADRGAALRRLRQLWDEGLASGEPREGGFDAEDIKRRGRARLAARGEAAAE
jgi:antitoxin ParD1/3/4